MVPASAARRMKVRPPVIADNYASPSSRNDAALMREGCAIPAHHQPVTAVFDLMNPERTGGWPRHLRRLARFDEAGGTAHDHGRRAIVVMLPPRAVIAVWPGHSTSEHLVP
jgi:hypothetical protein